MTEMDNKLENILEWQRDHDAEDNKRFNDLHDTLKKIPCKDDIRAIVDQSIQDNITDKGRVAKNVIVTTAIIITSVTAILIGVKTFLAWLGINIVR